MPTPPILKINEIFSSVQGEGLRQGEPTIFIRLTGCNLRCDFCDTANAWEQGQEKTVTQIIDVVTKLRKNFKAEWICLTGGEPLLQDISDLVKGLKNEHFKIQVETNATRFQSLPFDWVTVSPKPENYFFRAEFKNIANEVKLVVSKELDYKIVAKFRRDFPEETPVLLQPQSNKKWSMNQGSSILKKSLSTGLKNIKLSIQLHKIYGIR